MKNCPCRNCKSKEVNYLPALGIILFIAGMLIVGTLDYKVLVM